MSAWDLGVRAVARCDALGVHPYSEEDGRLVRRFLTGAHAAALSEVRRWMVEAGMGVRLDGAANLIGRYEGSAPGQPALMIGSHIDTVRDGGRYDGALGIMLGIDCVEALSAQGRRAPFAIEVAAFGDEEGSRFPASMSCSRAIAGTLDATVLEVRDSDGVTMAEARARFDPPPPDIAEAARKPGEVFAYLEAHIEQGPVLEAEGLPVGIVTAIAAQERLLVRLTGTAGHAGTTPMRLRRDPGPGAAEIVLAVERICSASEGLVGTVGRMSASPGAFNVIPAYVEISLDVRAPTASRRDEAVARIVSEIEAVAARRRLSVDVEPVQRLEECPSDPELVRILEAAVQAVGVRPRRLPSGAGHDAMAIASLCPTAMLFIRCKDGISHSPAEAVSPEDARVAAEAMLAFIDRLAARERGDEGP